MNIILIGFMGCGKSTVGKKMSRQLGYSFIDVDKQIELLERLSIPEIFELKGETYFRKLEHNYLNENNFKNTVISVGGGTPCFYNNMEVLNKIGNTVYLEMNVGLLANRLVNAKQKRPLIEKYKNSLTELELRITNLLEERVGYYRQAKIIFNGINFNQSRLKELISLIHFKFEH